MAESGPAPSIVGALACQKDSYLQSLETEVVSCEELNPAKPAKAYGKSKSKKDAESNKNPETEDATSQKQYLIEFTDSVLFPEGGGQPTDYGTVTPLSTPSDSPISVNKIQRHGLRCVYFSPHPLTPGTKVRQDVDYSRRWDHMQQHTGQHLLSAILDSFDLPTLSWSMGTAGEMNYIEIPRKPSPAEIQHVQNRCNRIIRENTSITVETPDDKDAEATKVPGDYDKEKGVVRFIKIGDLDFNACCGTHLQQTSHIGLILLHHTQSVRGANCRLFFSAGDRAIKLATESIDTIRNVAVSLSSSAAPEEVEGSVRRLSELNAEARKREKKMLTELAHFEGERIKAALHSGKLAWSHRATDGLDFVNLVVSEVRDSIKENHVVVVASGEVGTVGSIVITGDKSLVESMAGKAKELVSTAKGGGKGEKWQGKVTEWKRGELEGLQKSVEGFR